MGDRLQFEMHIQEELNDFYTPRFILQPIVENSILHGLGAIRGVGVITLTVRDLPDAVSIRVADNGGGIPEKKLEEIQEMLSGVTLSTMSTNVGIGLYNVSERIKSYFGKNSGIHVESRMGQETVFELRLGKEGGYRHVKAVDRG
jgi:two-component system sensor histidine kinase YesM